MNNIDVLAYTNVQICNIIRKLSKKKALSEEDKEKLEILKKEAWKRGLEFE